MKKYKYLLCAVLLVIGSVNLSASGSKDDVEEPSSSAVEAPEEQESSSHSVVDHLGRTVEIPDNPQRILALNSAAMEALFNLGFEPVGKIDEYKIRPEGVALPSVGATTGVDIEAIYQLHPDLIIAHMRHHGRIIESLEQTEAAIFCFNPEDVGDSPLAGLTVYLGDLLGREEQAEAYFQSISALAEDYTNRIASLGLQTAVILRSGDTITAAQPASGYGSVLEQLGLTNVVPSDLPKAKKTSFVPYDLEALLQANPDLVFFITAAKKGEDNQRIIEQYGNDPKWAGLRAVENGYFLALPWEVNPNRSSTAGMLTAAAEAVLRAGE